MAAASGRSDVLKILAEKMQSSCVDSHYTSKYWVRLNPTDATRPQGAPTETFFGNAMTRLLLFPIWLPYWFWKRRETKRQMIEFVVAGTSGIRAASLLTDDELTRQLALEWVDRHPVDFYSGARAKMAKLHGTFKEILSENTGRN